MCYFQKLINECSVIESVFYEIKKFQPCFYFATKYSRQEVIVEYEWPMRYFSFLVRVHQMCRCIKIRVASVHTNTGEKSSKSERLLKHAYGCDTSEISVRRNKLLQHLILVSTVPFIR